MNVGILGSGIVGLRLGDGFLALGDSVKIGTRDTSKENIASWISKNGKKATVGSFEETASFGDIVLIATLWSGTMEAIRLANPKNFAKKIIIDVTNPLDFSKTPPRLAIGHTASGGEMIQNALPDARVVKAFNTVGNAHFFHPNFPGGHPTMPICGNDPGAKEQVIKILSKFGWEALDVGEIEGARLLEPLAMLWISHFYRSGAGNHAFKILRK